MSNYLKYILMLIVVAVASFAAHYLLSNALGQENLWALSGYTLWGLYGFGFAASFVVLVLILLAQWAMPKNLGLIFLGVMTLKAIASYIFIQNGLGKFDTKFLEYNFLVVFFIFLFFDVFVAFKALNQEDTNVGS
ncbi:hypothetical protein ACL9RF_13125 [Sphingobacterium sp. Mn56C]|uniref:hypothetical protein n=1 Tax=Sphingobacterium sp. Mn56C TaxID=3395261 RepID=UPI003BDE22C1